MFPITTIGYMGNNVYPARAGEVLRAVILKRKEGVSVSASLATIIVERIFDGVVMLAFVFVNFLWLRRQYSAGGNHRNRGISWSAGSFSAGGDVPTTDHQNWVLVHLSSGPQEIA
jgi:uncharacterized membrane protein YbhN (UPF0104 family)